MHLARRVILHSFLIRVILLALTTVISGVQLAHADLMPTGMAKPVADLRDYDGTYRGSPGTGRIGYSTLYRDNDDNGVTSGVVGEGYGSRSEEHTSELQ